MLNRINIDFFANGYSLISGGDCFDLPVATIIGNYKKKLYYYYSNCNFFCSLTIVLLLNGMKGVLLLCYH